MNKLTISIVIGSLLGLIGSRFLFVGSSLSLIPWSIAGLIIGYFSLNRNEALKIGAVYGFFLSFVFMLSGYSGSASVMSRIPFFLILGIFGAICGIILALIGNLLRNKFKLS